MVWKSVRWRKIEVIWWGKNQRGIQTLFLNLESPHLWATPSDLPAAFILRATHSQPGTCQILGSTWLWKDWEGLKDAVMPNEKSLKIWTELHPSPFGEQENLAGCRVFTIFHINDACEPHEAYSAAQSSWDLTHCNSQGKFSCKACCEVVKPHCQKPQIWPTQLLL